MHGPRPEPPHENTHRAFPPPLLIPGDRAPCPAAGHGVALRAERVTRGRVEARTGGLRFRSGVGRRRGDPGEGRQRGRRRRSHRVRAGGDASERREHRWWRVHDHPPGQRHGDDDRLPRACAGQVDTHDVPRLRREDRSPVDARGLARVRRAGNGSWSRDGAQEVRQAAVG